MILGVNRRKQALLEDSSGLLRSRIKPRRPDRSSWAYVGTHLGHITGRPIIVSTPLAPRQSHPGRKRVAPVRNCHQPYGGFPLLVAPPPAAGALEETLRASISVRRRRESP